MSFIISLRSSVSTFDFFYKLKVVLFLFLEGFLTFYASSVALKVVKNWTASSVKSLVNST